MLLGKTQREIAEEWLVFTIKNWRKQLRQLKIKSKGDLDASFEGSVITAAGGDLDRVTLAYAWYGQMVDMGVGRGTGQGDQKDNATSRRLIGRVRGNQRRPKRWYSKGRDSIGHQVNQLGDLLGEHAAIQGTEAIAGSISKRLVIKI